MYVTLEMVSHRVWCVSSPKLELESQKEGFWIAAGSQSRMTQAQKGWFWSVLFSRIVDHETRAVEISIFDLGKRTFVILIRLHLLSVLSCSPFFFQFVLQSLFTLLQVGINWCPECGASQGSLRKRMLLIIGRLANMLFLRSTREIFRFSSMLRSNLL